MNRKKMTRDLLGAWAAALALMLSSLAGMGCASGKVKETGIIETRKEWFTTTYVQEGQILTSSGFTRLGFADELSRFEPAERDASIARALRIAGFASGASAIGLAAAGITTYIINPSNTGAFAGFMIGAVGAVAAEAMFFFISDVFVDKAVTAFNTSRAKPAAPAPAASPAPGGEPAPANAPATPPPASFYIAPTPQGVIAGLRMKW